MLYWIFRDGLVGKGLMDHSSKYTRYLHSESVHSDSDLAADPSQAEDGQRLASHLSTSVKRAIPALGAQCAGGWHHVSRQRQRQAARQFARAHSVRTWCAGPTNDRLCFKSQLFYPKQQNWMDG